MSTFAHTGAFLAAGAGGLARNDTAGHEGNILAEGEGRELSIGDFQFPIATGFTAVRDVGQIGNRQLTIDNPRHAPR